MLLPKLPVRARHRKPNPRPTEPPKERVHTDSTQNPRAESRMNLNRGALTCKVFPRPAGLGCTQLAPEETRGKSNGESAGWRPEADLGGRGCSRSSQASPGVPQTLGLGNIQLSQQLSEVPQTPGASQPLHSALGSWGSFNSPAYLWAQSPYTVEG